MDSSVLELKTLTQGFKLSCQTEGKSPKTVEWYTSFLERFRRFLESNGFPTPIDSITKSHIRAFIRYLQEEARTPRSEKPLSQLTVQGYVRTLKAFFSWTTREEYLETNPMTNIPVPKAVTKIINTLSQEQIATLFNVCRNRDSLGCRNLTVILLLLDSGMRVSELVNIDVDDVNLTEGHLKIRRAKGNKERLVPIGSLVQKMLWKYLHCYRPRPLTDKMTRLFLSDSGLSLTKILFIWVLAALPMPFLTFLIGPALAPVVGLDVKIARWMMIIIGLIWLFVLSMIVLRRELGTLRWSVIRKRMWYQKPRDPKTGKPKAKLLWWAVPAVLVNALCSFTLITPTLQEAVLTVLPFVRPWVMLGQELLSPEYVGQWWIVGVWLVSALFNYLLGEEFLFRGVLLPKMKGVFGRWDWFMNVVLFSFWHLHQPWGFLSVIVTFSLAGWASRRYQCNWIFAIAHGIDGLFMTVLLTLVVAGLGP